MKRTLSLQEGKAPTTQGDCETRAHRSKQKIWQHQEVKSVLNTDSSKKKLSWISSGLGGDSSKVADTFTQTFQCFWDERAWLEPECTSSTLVYNLSLTCLQRSRFKQYNKTTKPDLGLPSIHFNYKE